MEIKKSKKASLEGIQTTSVLIGLIIALGALYVAFEFSQTDIKVDIVPDAAVENVEEEIVQVTRRYIPPPPPPPQTVQADLLDIVEDNTLEEDVEFESTEDDKDEAVETNYGDEGDGEAYGEEEVFAIVEQMPQFPGGESALMRFITKNMRYPTIAAENGIQGRVICTFVIGKDGKVSQVQVMRSVDPALDKEAIRVISMLPAWKPGKQRGRPVRVRYTLPIVFRLDQ